jgi:cytochrome c
MMRTFLVIIALSAASAGPVAAQEGEGALLFKQRCQVCHQVKAGAPAVLGPNLRGVVGRKAAATQFRHTPAFAKAKLVWTKENLDKFMKAPVKFVPGTRMNIAVSDPAQRKSIIEYLATMK